MRQLRLLVAAVVVARARGVGRVIPLLNGDHLDNLFKDTREHRPATLLAVYSSAHAPCAAAWAAGFDVFRAPDPHRGEGHRALPSRAHLLLATYDRAARALRLTV